MFWNKSKPAAPAVPPVVPPYDPSSLEKGADSDRSSDYSTADSSPQGSPIKSFVVSLPQQPKAAHTTHETHSQTRSVDEHSSVGVQSFPVLATDGHRCRVADSTGRRILKRYWIVVAIALFTTVTVIGSTAIVVAKKKTASAVQVFRDADVATYQSNTSGYWLVSDGNLVSFVTPTHLPATAPATAPTPTPTPKAS